MKLHRIMLAGLVVGTAAIAREPAPPGDPDARAAAIEAQMTPEEKTSLTIGLMAIDFGDAKAPEGAIPGAGHVSGVPRLGVPALAETDASLGVSYIGGLRGDGATALPSGVAMGASWNPDLLREAGAMIAREAHAKGFNVLLAGGINLMRDPRNGRTFEYLGEDPLHAGLLAGASVAGIQSENVISTLKHFAFNGQETGRHFLNSKISDAAARESELLAFEIAIEIGEPGAIMCAYNRVNGPYACDNDYLLNKVLKEDWGYKGWVMSDWGATPGLQAALNGLDQQSGAQLDDAPFFGEPLREAAQSDPRYAERLSDMVRRVLRSIYAVGVDRNPPQIRPIDFAANGRVAQRVAEQGIVLLRNQEDALPLSRSVRRIAIIGGFAEAGVLSGGGSSQVQGEGGPVVSVPLTGGGDALTDFLLRENYHRSSPMNAIAARAPKAKITYRDGRYVTDAVLAAKNADVAIVFATQWMTEGLDVPDLSLPRGQDALIAAVAEANPNTIVVLETGGPVVMPWLERTAAVVEAWYPGARGGEAIAAVLFGEVNPSGRLPVTFPASVEQLPRPRLDGADTVEPNFPGLGAPGQTLEVDYDIEGSDGGYRWFARKGEEALFPFGYGLSYTRFEHGDLKVNSGEAITAEFTIRNVGKRAGADVPQLYLISAAGKKKLRLAGFKRVELKPGERRKVSVELDPRILAEWENGGWSIAPGEYVFALGRSAEDFGPRADIILEERRWRP